MTVNHVKSLEPNLKDYEVKDGKLYGRGACDMKNGNAIIMLVMQYFAHQEDKPSLGAMFTTDEEIGGRDGAKYLVEQGYRCKVCLIPDGGKIYDQIVVAGKGILELRVTAKGKSTHGSRVWEGENAIEKLMDTFRIIKAEFPPEDREDHWYETVNLGKLNGGTATNKVPDFAQMELDFRFTEKYTSESLYQKIRKLVPDDIDIKITSTGEPVFVEPDNPYLKEYLTVNREILSKEAIQIKEHGATDGRHFAKYGIPILIQQPDRVNYHGLNEYTVIDTLEPIYEIYKKFVERVAQKGA